MTTPNKVSPTELAAVRDEVSRLSTDHKTAHTAAMTSLKDRQAAMASGEATTLVESETVEMFAAADKLAEQLDGVRAIEASMLRSRFGSDQDDAPSAAQAAARGDRADVVSIASRAMANEEFVQAAARGRNGLRGRSFDVLSAAETAAMLKTGSIHAAAQLDGGPLIPDDQSRLGDAYRLPLRMPSLLEVLPTGTTSSDLVKFVRKTTNTPGISGQVAGTPFTEATYAYTAASAPVVSRGAMLPVPEDNLADVGRLASLLNRSMVDDNRRDLENQVINGDGIGQNMTGILNTAGIGSLTRNSGESLADAVHRVITSIRTNAFTEPDWIAYGAADWETLALEKASDGHYVNGGGIFAPVPFTLWGISSVLGHVLGANTLVGGRFAETEVVVRQGITIEEFQGEVAAAEQLVHLRGKYRAAFIVEVPQAFTVLDTTVVI